VFRRRRKKHEIPDRIRAAEPGGAPGQGRPVADEQGETVAWIVDHGGRRARELWQSAAETFKDTGLWPVLVQRGEYRPQFLGPVPPSNRNPAAVLRQMWAEGLPETAEELEEIRESIAPFGPDFPGLGQGGDRRAEHAFEAAMRTMDGFSGVLLVPVTRPADAIAATGWLGAANYSDDPGELTAVLRSWEDRYDAVLVGMSMDQLFLAVRRPPRGRDAALALAAEQRAFCVDIVDQGFGSIRALAAALDATPAWAFWWD
jgi:hypothetical protein